MFRAHIDSYFNGLEACRRELSPEKLERVLEILLSAHREGSKVFVLGNGGSASTASHFACDLGKGTAAPGAARFRVISIADNLAVLTAWANDSTYEMVFKEQLENLLEPGDVVVGISASGNSPNVIRAVEYANQRGAVTVGFLGFGGGRLRELVQLDITVSSRNYGQVEDFHLTLNHILTQYLSRVVKTGGNSEAVASPQ